jgi:uncharacterized peroxidase-related enzyme
MWAKTCLLNGMQRITAVIPSQSTGKAKKLLDGVQAKLGITPNMMATMATSPAVLEGYLQFSSALAAGSLSAQFREQIALAVAQANGCEYCLSAHTFLGSHAGLSGGEIALGRTADSEDAKRAAGLRFAQAIVVQRGAVSDAAVAAVKAAGYTDGEISEIIANVAVNIFTNYFNLIAGTEIDFPRVSLSMETAAA